MASNLDVSERTLRRAAAEGLIHGQRLSERRYKTSLREEAYLRQHWTLLSGLRAALRTEPNARLAVLFGSFAKGEESETSDVDVLVSLRDATAAALADLSGRLSDRIGRDVQLVRTEEAERSSTLMADVLAHGRVLVDRDRIWLRLTASRRRWQRRTNGGRTPLQDAMPDLGL
ncbi:MAG: nucleotidyltransferase domain-containing protein [Solirubrobacteraceae bacterium]